MRLTVPAVVCRHPNTVLPSVCSCAGTFAAASAGLPASPPARPPIRLLIPSPLRATLMSATLAALLLAALLLPVAGSLVPAAQAAAARTYVGTDACAPCHADQHATFRKYAKKSKSANSVKIMAAKLSREEVQGCYACHTTGYGKPGGFVSFESTPHLGDAGCEVCHGPGSAHVDSGGDVSLIDRPTMEGCVVCHNEQRVRSFNFKPLLHGGAH